MFCFMALPIKLFCHQIDKKHPLVKCTAKYVFFKGAVMKITVLVSWHTTLVSLC